VTTARSRGAEDFKTSSVAWWPQLLWVSACGVVRSAM